MWQRFLIRRWLDARRKMAEKRYYWLKLKNDFFATKEMKKLRKIAGGDTYTIIYLKLQLLSLKDEGKLYYDGIEESFAEELALTIDEDADNVKATLFFLQKCGLAEIGDSDLLLCNVPECIGSETGAAQRMRDQRNRVTGERNKIEQSSNKVQKRYTEIEKEKREDIEQEREIETDKEKERKEDIELEQEKELDSSALKEKTNIPWEKIKNIYNETCVSLPKIKGITSDRKKHISGRLNQGFTIDDFVSAFKEAEGSSFCRGLNDRHWMATFDFIISERGMTRLLEGRYRDKDGVSHNASDPVRIDFQRYRDADGEFSVSFETLGNGRKKMTMSYDSGLTKVLEYDNDTRPTWLQ
jgi:predicted phage replisome organizer